jgi:hypothetical protein
MSFSSCCLRVEMLVDKDLRGCKKRMRIMGNGSLCTGLKAAEVRVTSLAPRASGCF